MKLTERDRLILGHMELDHRSPASVFAERLGLREHIVRATLKKFSGSGLLRKRLYLNPYGLGFSVYSILLACRELTRQQSSFVASALISHPSVVTVIEIGGGYDYQVDVFARDLRELNAFFEWMALRLGDLLVDKNIAAQPHQTIYGFKFGTQGLRRINEVSYSLSDIHSHALDDVDMQILIALQQDVQLASASRVTGIPLNTVMYRVERLQRAGVIQGHIFEMTGPDLGLSSYIFRIFANGLDPSLRSELLRFCGEHPFITFFNTNLGHWDYTIGVSVPQQLAMKEVQESVAGRFGRRIARIEVHERYRSLKVIDFPVPGHSASFVANG